MIEEKLESLIEMYTLEIKDETKNLKKVERMANEILLKKEFLLDLKYMKGEN